MIQQSFVRNENATLEGSIEGAKAVVIKMRMVARI